MHLSSALIAGISLGLFMAIAVGPTLFAVIRYSLNHSYKAGLAFVFGVSISDIIYVTIASMASPWLQKLHTYARPISYGAAILLIGVGCYGFFKKFHPQKSEVRILTISNAQYLRIFLSGFLINTLNPALIFQWILAATSVAGETTAYHLAFFGSCLGVVLGIDVLKVFLADNIRRRLTQRRIMMLQKISALCILIIGIGVLTVAVFNISFKNPLPKPQVRQAVAA